MQESVQGPGGGAGGGAYCDTELCRRQRGGEHAVLLHHWSVVPSECV